MMDSEMVMEEMKQVKVLEGHKERVWHVSWSHDAKFLASCGGDKSIRIWASKNKSLPSEWSCIATLDEAQSRAIRSCEWSPCSRYLAAVSFDATTVIWERNGEEFELIATLEGHESEVKSVAWSTVGSYIATCSRDKSVWVWDADQETDFECLSVLHGHSQDVKFVKWHPQESVLFSASYDDTIKIWEEDEGHTSTVWGLCSDADGNRLISCSADKTVIVWQRFEGSQDVYADGRPMKWKKVCTLSGYHEKNIYSIDWCRHTGLIATGSEDNSIRIFKELQKSTNSSPNPSFELIYKQEDAHVGDVNCVRWSPCQDGYILLASAGDDGNVRVWQFNS